MKELLHARTKFFAVIIISAILTTSRNPYVIGAALFILGLGISLNKKHPELRRRLKVLLNVSLIILLFQILFNTSVSIEDRILTGLLSAGKITAISILVFLYTSLSSPGEIISVFSFLPAGYKLALTVSLGLIPVIFDEYEKISLVQKSRGMKLNRLNPIGNTLPVIIPLLHRILRRAEQLAFVVYSKGFDNI